MEDYYDIEQILATEERVPVTFNCDAQGLGYLVHGVEEDLTEGTRLELPFWLADALVKQNNGIQQNKGGVVSINMPRYYSQKYRNHLKSNPTSVDLRSVCQVYYQLGMRLSPWLGLDEMTEMSLKKDLVEALVDRYFGVLDFSQNSSGDDTSDFMKQLTEEERTLFGLSYSAAIEYDQWRSREHGKLKVSRLIKHDRKRRKVARTPS